MKFFFYFFAETETLWSQGPVTRDFWKSYSIRPRYLTFKHFHACSAFDEIGSAYAHCSVCDKIRSAFAQHGLYNIHVKMFTFYRWLSNRGNSSRNPSNGTKVKKNLFWISLKKIWFRVCSVSGNVRKSKFWRKSMEKKEIFFEHLRRAYKDLI